MEEESKKTKKCPYCGEEILATARKCKHCGEWLEEKPADMQQGQTTPNLQDGQHEENPMSAHVRKGITNAHINEENAETIYTEILIIAVAIGIYMKSWWWFGGALVGLFILFCIPYIGALLSFVLSLAWGVIGYAIGDGLIGSNAAGWVIGILAFIFGLGVHSSGREWFKDIE